MCPISDLQACEQHALSCRARHKCRREISGSRDHAMCNIQNRTSSSSPADKSSKCVIMYGDVFIIYIYKVAAQSKEVAARASCTASCIRYLICSLLPCPILPNTLPNPPQVIYAGVWYEMVVWCTRCYAMSLAPRSCNPGLGTTNTPHKTNKKCTMVEPCKGSSFF
jgi:hypothetical protein